MENEKKWAKQQKLRLKREPSQAEISAAVFERVKLPEDVDRRRKRRSIHKAMRTARRKELSK